MTKRRIVSLSVIEEITESYCGLVVVAPLREKFYSTTSHAGDVPWIIRDVYIFLTSKNTK